MIDGLLNARMARPRSPSRATPSRAAVSLRETIQRSVREIRVYWRERGVWPDAPPIGLDEALRTARPTDMVCAACGSDLGPGEVREVWVGPEGWARGVCSERCESWLTVRGRGTPLDPRRVQP